MPTAVDCVCCHDIKEVMKIMKGSPTLRCVSNHEGFDDVCLNRYAVQVAVYQHKEDNPRVMKGVT